ncbi:MAG: hypothetical protein KIT44_15830 [Opitutaceae bacterium]|nr:hypothetical protein [Opitutaceae bacterium]
MKRRLLFLALGVLLGAAGSYLLLRHRPPRETAEPPVAIQDGKTIDFSSGRAEVRDTPEDRAAMEQALKEMEAAAKDVTFGPTRSPTPPPAP